ncbi:hypothetical protein PAECIP111893_01459 [Paenibacillus plantiphilus]|uniref:Amidohydrolase-related domain-containing protein n=1 Tax=Paenibacillus plantiphilus TaxID=2905650 RepID=A0ABM9C0Z4_9BACL|nr:N-acetylglucosamine-6-phosphate deacetylase [Paenibacillus plantiphilus]CAH1200571.1 hypothetical protein PAECIP111893_01459 [Paenibacillus plantiphilus]
MSKEDKQAVAGLIADGLGGEPYYGIVVIEDGVIERMIKTGTSQHDLETMAIDIELAQAELESAQAELESAHAELESALADLQSAVSDKGGALHITRAEKAIIAPGFVDLHVHGGGGADVMDADKEQLAVMIGHHLRHGSTSIVATTMTAPKADIEKALATVETFRCTSPLGGAIIGVHLEGPFISPVYPGAQNPSHIAAAHADWIEDWNARHPGLLRILTLAPETEGAEKTIRTAVSHGIVAACGHSNATYDMMQSAIGWGVTHSVHCCNGMRPFHHREPGVVGAILLHAELSTELIMDGHHLHPASSDLVRRVKGNRVCVVTDAMRASGMPDGEYTLGDLDVNVREGIARLKEDGSLAGSTLTMQSALAELIRQHGLALHEALPHATSIPAGIIGAADKGRIEAGAAADLLLLDPAAYTVQEVMLGGSWIGVEGS